jgi:hypothetical protein
MVVVPQKEDQCNHTSRNQSRDDEIGHRFAAGFCLFLARISTWFRRTQFRALLLCIYIWGFALSRLRFALT